MNFNTFQRRSLKTKLTLTTLVIFVISIWSLAFYASRMLKEDMERQSGEQQFSTVSFMAAAVNEELDNRFRSLKDIAAQVSPALLDNTAALQAHLEQRPILQILFNGGTFATGINGTAIADFPLSTGRRGVNYMDRDFIAAALKDGKSTIGRPVVGKRLKSPIFVIGAPIRDAQGKVIGALAGVTDLSKPNFLDKITESNYGKTGGYLLVARQHRLIVTATNKSRIMAALPAPGINPMIDRFIQGHEGSLIYVNPLGIEQLASVKNIPVADWYMNVTLPTAEAFAPIRNMQQRILMATIFFTLLAGGLIWWMTWRILRRQLSPMLAATETLNTMAGTISTRQPLAITSHDEIGELIAGFNRLLETLAQQDVSLQESEMRYRTVADFTSEWEFWIMPDGTFRYISPSCEQVCGYSRDEFYADPQLLTRIIHPDDLDLYAGHTHHLSAGGVIEPLDYRIRTKDGEYRWISHVCRTVYDPAGQSNGRRASNRDITKRKQTEEALRAHRRQLTDIIEFLPDATLAIDKEGRVIIWNKAIEEMTGVPAAEIIGKGDHAYSIPFYGEARPQLMDLVFEDHEDILTRYPQLTREGDTLMTEVFCNALYDNKGAWVIAKASPLHDQSGNIIGAIESIRDITERKRAEEEIKTKNEELENYLYTASHDLRSPLVNIQGFSQRLQKQAVSIKTLLSDTILAPETKEGIEKITDEGIPRTLNFILSNVTKMDVLLNGLLRISHTGRTVMTIKKIDMNQLFKTVIGTYNYQLTELDATVTTAELPFCHGDENLLNQMISNIIGNAIKYREKGKTLAIDISAHQELNKVIYSIKDNGIGIDPRHLTKIWNMFYRVDSASGDMGDGLGLNIVKRIVDKHKGRVWAESELGKGSSFFIELQSKDF